MGRKDTVASSNPYARDIPEDVLTTTNHISEDMLELVSKRQAVKAVKSWSGAYELQACELSSRRLTILESHLAILVMRQALRKIAAMNNQAKASRLAKNVLRRSNVLCPEIYPEPKENNHGTVQVDAANGR